MDRDPLEGANLKLKRAEKHIRDLYALLEFYRNCKPYIVWREDDPQTDEQVVKARIIGEVPSEVALTFGDAIHNLRAALDFIWRELESARRTDGIPVAEEIRFPFAWTPKALESKYGTKIRALGGDVDQVMRYLKPYKGGNDFLFLLHRLDIEDKHKVLVALNSGGVAGFGFDAPMKWAPAGEDIELGRFAKSMSFLAGSEPENQMKPMIQVTLTDVGVDPQPIEAIVSQFSSMTRHIVEQLSYMIMGAW